MPKVESRLRCPACLGATLKKVEIGARKELVLDYCPRCGGMWFERGEVQGLRRSEPEALWQRIPRRRWASHMSCHSCQAKMERNAAVCPGCGWENRLECPSCGKPMKVEAHEGLRLDVCEKCRGVWFDHEELEPIWRFNVEAALSKRRAAGQATNGGEGIVLLEALAYSPDLVFFGAYAAGHAVSGAVHLIGHAPEAAAVVVEGAGDAAEGIFAAVAEIIGSIFDAF